MSAPISHAWETFSFSDNSLNGGLSVQKVSLLSYTMQFLIVNNVCDIYSPHSSYFCSPEVLFRNEITYRCLHVHLFIEQYYRLLVDECTICYMFFFSISPIVMPLLIMITSLLFSVLNIGLCLFGMQLLNVIIRSSFM